MIIELNDKEIKTFWQLRNCLNNGSLNLPELVVFFDGLGRKLTAAPPPEKVREKKKNKRKSVYRRMIQNNINGNKKIV